MVEGTGLFGPAYTQPGLSPDGTRLAWVSDRGGRPQLWVAPLPADGPLDEPHEPLLPDTDVVALTWSPDSSSIAVQIAPFGGERTRVRIVDAATGAGRDLATGAAAATLGAWSPTGRQLGITILSEHRNDGQACLVDLRDGTSTVLTSGPAAKVCAVSGDGRRAVMRTGKRGARGLELVDLRSGRRTNLLPGGALVAEARFGITGHQLYVHTDAGRDRAALLAVTLRGSAVSGVYPVAERDGDDLDMVALDPAGARAALVWNVGGRSELELLDLRSGRLEPGPPIPGDVVTGAGFTRDGRALVVASEGPTVPPRISRAGLGSTVTEPLLPAAPAVTSGLVDPVPHTFRADDGLTLSGWLLRPAGAVGPGPTIIWLHGGPESQERPTAQPLFQALVAAGISVFAPNVRGSSGYGRRFAAADDLDRRFAAIADVRAAADHLTSAGLADPDRLGVAGRSYGGYLTLAALAAYPERFAVGVDICGMSDLASFFAHTEPWIASAATTKYGDPDVDAALLRELSPLHRADRIRAPLLVVHGEHDTNVPMIEATQIVEALRAHGRTPELLRFADEGHEIHDRANREVFVRAVVAWVAAALLSPRPAAAIPARSLP
ncbi:S9 family peptidase [Pseudonocardia sp. TRM90224]|uniref:S9 family peptidase n=1 Tax=Pseudonocardia sp. TRM90224 TaxID=2812678 RepID=UPI001E654CAD|nr:prolyl oligopeptidase family serine peptidase [Pseudonocardia sp. TRM90224]